MSNSSLVSYTKLSPNHSGRRTHKIDNIAIHCMAGNLSVEACGNVFAQRSRKASSNYGIGSDGRIALYVDEANRSWCTSSSAVDNRSITIEVANSVAAHPWPVTDKAYNALIDLLVDICKRNGIKKLLWQANKNLYGQVDKQNMVAHRWFAAKACPGDYLYNRFGDIANKVNARLVKGTAPTPAPAPKKEEEIVTLSDFKKLYAQMRKEWQDNDANDYSKEARKWVVDKGIIKGTGDKSFVGSWEDVLTREQMATMLYRFAQAIGKA